MAYWKLHYHFVWATKLREATLSEEISEIVKRSIRLNFRDLSVKIHALETMPDHVHLAVSVPPTLSPSQFMNKIKGASSHLVTLELPDRNFYWQPEYGVHSFAEDALPRITQYIINQRQHHHDQRIWPSLEIAERS
jgi:putative transposase